MGWRTIFGNTKCVPWLAKEGGINLETAQKTIDEFPILVHPIMNRNPWNPRMFLRIAAGLLQKPDIIIFDTSGMDPQGIELLNEYIQEHLGDIFAVRICWPTIKPDKNDCVKELSE